MTDIKPILDSCPMMDGYRVNELAGLMPGVFPRGVVRTKTDILGNVRQVKRYVLKKRCVRNSSWAEEVTAWALARGLTVTGGMLTTPATDGTGIYEVTVEV